MTNWTRTRTLSGIVDIWSVPDMTGQTDGNTVSSLVGLVNSIALSQATSSNQPTYTANWANSQPALTFDGVSDFLQATWQAALAPSTFTAFLVYGQSGMSNNVGLFSNRDGSGHGYGAYLSASQLNGYVNYSGLSTGSQPTAPTVFAFDSTASAQHVYLSGTLKATGAATYTPSASGPLNLGAYAGATGSSFWPGKVAALILFNRVLSASERAQVDSDVQDLFGITVSDYVSSTPKGTVAGTVAWTGAVSGKATHSGNVTGTVAWAGSTSGTTTHKGSTAGTVAWTGAVSGTAPSAVASGHVAGTVVWAGAVSGSTKHDGTIAGAVTWTGAVNGTAPHLLIPDPAAVATVTLKGSKADVTLRSTPAEVSLSGSVATVTLRGK